MEDLETCLSKEALDALQSFYLEHHINDVEKKFPEEDWALSQFWYDDRTSEVLAKAAYDTVIDTKSKRIACISCPSVYKKLVDIYSQSEEFYLFEYDKRFHAKYPDGFIFYDYKNPMNLEEKFKFYFDIVLADPPFLSEECLEKFSQTIRLLTNQKIVLCTGAVMEQLAMKLLDLNACDFKPRHERHLGNDFRCFANFNFDDYIKNDS